MFRFLRTSSHYFTPSFLMACLIASSQANASKRVVDEREETALFYAVENESTFSDWSKEKYISYPINHDFGKSFDENTRYAIARMPEDQVAYEEAISQIKKRPRNTPKEAYNTILNLAAQGDAQAQMDLGWLHVRQGDDHENLKAAIYHYEAAKKNGHPEANIALGRIAVSQATTAQETLGHEHPLVAENFQQAATHFHDGFLNGHFECTMELGNLINLLRKWQVVVILAKIV
ncbi:MAG: sel1 repeat family protein [Alphaproteobacteria bacterium]|nr:sel1 repeat family protein [Alphaproteobacteria bacterium]